MLTHANIRILDDEYKATLDTYPELETFNGRQPRYGVDIPIILHAGRTRNQISVIINRQRLSVLADYPEIITINLRTRLTLTTEL